MSTAFLEQAAQTAAPVNRSWPLNKRYLSPKEAAAYLGMGLSTLGIHRMHGTGPDYIKWGMNIRYDIAALDDWMERHRVTPAPAPVTEKRRVGRPRKQHAEVRA